jgi:uncharacterized membrane protein YgdD (TMEM256/DUF423 family)
MSRLVAFAALSGAVAVAAGAFGAHGAHGLAAEWLKTGATYQLIHVAAALAISGRGHIGPAKLLVGGAAIFALTLYAMAFGAPRWLGAVTPIGGAMMIGGWLWLAYRGWASRNASTSARDTDLST